ncbi:solute carrier organic anion transporter family member 1A4-like [Physella acuta]|uniref:solute carrier organic anion transporter family member 1A4-like n=1 Tax=Physella acuta TaxID=109671 RepID=UPI0027DD57F5|nr:solute carrier organic anion transporter family member 1A4-like [Physella acuta]
MPSMLKRTCCVGPCRSRLCKRFPTLPAFVVCYGISGIWTMAMGSLLGSQITSIERHLGISSSKTGLIMSSNEIGYLVAVLFGSHFGKYLHIPRLLSVSGVIFGVMAMVMSLGKLMQPKVWQEATVINSNPNGTENGFTKYLCLPENMDDNITSGTNLTDLDLSEPRPYPSGAASSPAALPWAFWVFVLASVVCGMVKSYRIPLVTHYVETNIKDKTKSGLYLGNSFTAMILGPPIALLLGSFVSSLPVDLSDTTMSKSDQRWIGAWWLGFVIVGVACCLFSLPIAFFPRHIRLAKLDKKEHEKSKLGKLQAVKRAFLEMPKSLWRMFRNPLYVLCVVCSVIEGMAFSGWFAFSQKYIETQFNKTSQQVSLTTGLIIIFSLAIGTFLGGLITSRLKLAFRGCAIITMIIAAATLALDSTYLVFGCQNSDVVGLQSQISSAACGCGDDVFLVCGDNNQDYLSPCLAGCLNSTSKIFNNCTEINGGGSARPGLCSLDCPFFIPYMVIFSAGMLLGTTGIVPAYMMIARSVAQQDQALAVGVSYFSTTLMGVLPSPILFGKVIDSTCLRWSAEGGYCMLYDREMFRYLINGLSLGLRSVHILVLSVVLLLVRYGRGTAGNVTSTETKTTNIVKTRGKK